MSSLSSESFYLAELGVEKAKPVRPHPPAPLLPVAIGLIVGIACDARWALRGETYVCGFVAAGLGMWACGGREWARWALLALATAAAGGILHDAHFRHLPEDHIARFVADRPALVSLSGYVVRAPRLIESTRPGSVRPVARSKFMIALEAAETEGGSVALRGLLAVTVQEPVFDLYAGDRVRVFGKLYKPRPPDNPGEPDWALIQRRQGVHAGLICEHPEAIEKLPAASATWTALIGRLRLEARTLLLDDVLDNELDRRSLLNALVLGQRLEMDPQIVEAFRRTGTSHFLALSGMNIGMLAVFVWFVCRLAALPRRAAAAVVLIVLIAYAVLVEPSPSVLRASLIGIVLCTGYLLRVPANSLNSLCFAAILLLVWDPLQLFHPGFQLSFLVTLGIMYLTPPMVRPIMSRLQPVSASAASQVMSRKVGVGPTTEQNLRRYMWTSIWMGALRAVVYTFCISLAAWVVGTPLAAYHFNSVFTYGWPFTAIISPLMFATMISGSLKLALGLIWPSTSLVLGPVVSGSTEALLWVVKLLAKTPAAAIDVPRPPGWWLLLYYGFLIGVVLWSSSTRTRPIGNRRRRIGLAVSLALLAVVPFWRPRFAPGELSITLLAVGSGSATILELPDGDVWLYDAGLMGDYDVGRRTVLPALRERGIRRLEQVIISHPNYDHYSGLFSLPDVVRIDSVVIAPQFERFAAPGEADYQLLEDFRQRQIEIEHVHAGGAGLQALTALANSVELEVLWPPAELPADIASNDVSLVIRLTYAGRRILFTGDIEQYAQEELLKSEVDLHADVLILPHHGSVVPTTRRFIAAVAPRYLLRSSGKRQGEEPSEIEEIAAPYVYLNTADVGAITIRITADGLAVQSFRDRRR